MTDHKPAPPPHQLDLPAGILAVLLPGLGHLARGEVRRGLLAGGSVLVMFFGGLLIGGIDVVDRQEDRWWFLGQAFVGPVAFGVNHVHQSQFKAHGIQPLPEPGPDGGRVYETDELKLRGIHRLRSVFPRETREMVDVIITTPAGEKTGTRRLPVAVPAAEGEGPPNRKSLAKVNEIGTLYALCAGMLNIIVILDALFPNVDRVAARGMKPGASAGGKAAADA